MNGEKYEQIFELYKQIEATRKQITELRRTLEPEPVNDYELTNRNGNKVLLSSLFDERDELMVIHNMGKRCLYCTLWADGLNGFTFPINDRVPFVVTSPDTYEVQREFADSRGWKFNMLSTHGTTFTADLGFEPKPNMYYPGVSALVRKQGKLYRVSYDYFGPGDSYCAPWHLFDLFPKGSNGWQPKYNYSQQ